MGISTEDGIKDFALSAVCTHLGCVVPWVRSSNKFICPCHGSQYDENGKVVRGPAPLSLALAHTSIQDGNVAVSPWTETDFRTGLAPWWEYTTAASQFSRIVGGLSRMLGLLRRVCG